MIFGVDVGMRRLAVACVEAEVYLSVDLGTKAGDRQRELAGLCAWFSGKVDPEAEVWVETAIGGASGNMQTAIKLAMTVGALHGIARPGHMFTVAPSSWKAAVVGHGHADKVDVARWVKTRLPASAKACAGDQDLLDAVCIATYGQLVHEGRLVAPSGVQRRRPRRVLRKPGVGGDEPR